MHNNQGRTINRRDLTKSLGLLGAAGLAGCIGGDDDDGDDGVPANGDTDLGERVPTVTLQYFVGIAMSPFMETASPIVQENWEEALGINVDVTGKEVAAFVGEIFGDQRTHEVSFFSANTNPQRIDPNFGIVDTLRIDGAGDRQIGLNYSQYASCEYSIPAFEQERAPTVEERRELIHEADSIQSEDFIAIPLAPLPFYGAARSDLLDIESMGTFGPVDRNIRFVLDTLPVDRGTRKVMTIDFHKLDSKNPYHLSDPSPHIWVYESPLVVYGPDAELEPYLAESWSIDEGATQFTFELREATFQNGDPITADAVKFSFEFLQNNAEDMASAPNMGFESIETPDDRTVVFNFDSPDHTFLTVDAVLASILNPAVWSDADGNAGEFVPPDGYGSGPFELVEFTPGESFVLDTHTGHPEAPDTDDMSGLVMAGFREEATAIEALRAGEIQHAGSLSPDAESQLQDDENIRTQVGLDYYGFTLMMLYPAAPTKFVEFRQALGKAVDRQTILDVAYPHFDYDPIYESRVLLPNHPWSSPEENLTPYTDQPHGDPEGARQVLRDEGWGWDNDGNLHYPADADLTPLWPAESRPEADEFPCLDEILG